MMQPLFTIIVPVYKVELYLDRCVSVLLNQTFENIEIILVDDGSPDNCPSLCDAYANADSRVRVVHKKNGGLSDARNVGIIEATGKYIIFIDSDDYIDIDACERLIPYTVNGFDIIQIDAFIEYENLENRRGTINPTSYGILKWANSDKIYLGQEFLKSGLEKRCMPMNSWLYVFRRFFLIEFGLKFKFGILHEDEQFTPRALLKAKTVINPGIQMYHYIIREGSITQSKDLRKNCADLYDTCWELAHSFNDIEQNLRDRFYDVLVTKYLSIFYVGKIYRYGKEYIHKDFVKLYAKSRRNKLKARVFCFSPRIYCYTNLILKSLLIR